MKYVVYQYSASSQSFGGKGLTPTFLQVGQLCTSTRTPARIILTTANATRWLLKTQNGNDHHYPF